MKIDDILKNNRDSLDFHELPEGHEDRFAERLKSDEKRRNGNVFKAFFATVSSAAAVLIMFFLINNNNVMQDKNPDKNKETIVVNDYVALQMMRAVYDEKLESAIYRLEEILKNVDDTTRYEINLVIEELLNTSDELAEIAPMPYEKQMAITTQVYYSKLKALNQISDKLENVNKFE